MPQSSLKAVEAARSLVGRHFLLSSRSYSAAAITGATLPPCSAGKDRFRNWQRQRQTRCNYQTEVVAYSSQGSKDHDEEDFDEEYSDDDDDDDDERDNQPWKTLLELPARASWRASDPYPPEAVMEAQKSVLSAGGATAKQLRQVYEGIAASQKALAERRERERRRLVNNTPYSRRAKLRDEEILPVLYGRMETLANLRKRLAPNYAITKRVLEECQSLLGYHNPENKWKPKRVIDMGIGCGSASAAALEVFDQDIEWVHGIDSSKCMRECAKEFLEEIMDRKATAATNHRTNPPRLTLSGSISAEASPSTFDVAFMTYTATELPHVSSTLAAAAILWEKLSNDGIFVMIEPGTPDGFSSIRAVRNMLLDCCPPHPKPNGDVSNNDDDGDRDDNDTEVSRPMDQCHIIAPCTHNGPCPMERHQHNFFNQRKGQPTHQEVDEFEMEDSDIDDDDAMAFLGDDSTQEGTDGLVEETDFLNTGFCSFVQTMSSGSHLSKGEKFSYLVAQKRVPAYEGEKVEMVMKSPLFQNDNLVDLLARVYKAKQDPDKSDKKAKEQQRHEVQGLFEEALALESRYLDSEEDDLGLELLQGDVNRSSFGRIIRAPTKKRGHVYVDYCAAPGKLMRSRVSKALDYGVAPGLYTVARKSRWGGLWPDISTQRSSMPSDKEDEKNEK